MILENENPIIRLMLILPMIFGLLYSGQLFAWQVAAPKAEITGTKASLSLDSLPNPRSGSTYSQLKKSMDSLQYWKAQLNNYQLSADSLSPDQVKKVMALQSKSDSALKWMESTQQEAATKLTQLEDKASYLQDSIHQALQNKIEQLRTKGKLSPKLDSLWQKSNHLAVSEKLVGKTEKLKGAASQIGNLDQLTNQLRQEKISPEFTNSLHEKLSELKGTIHEKEQLSQVKSQAETWKSTFNKEYEQLGQSISIDKLNLGQQQWQEYTGKVQAYQEQVNNAPDVLEQKARDLEAVKAFENKKAAFSPYQEQMSQLGKEGYAKEQAVQKAKTMAKDHFAGQQEKLLAAQSKLTKLKQKMGKLGSLNGGKLKKENEMKGKTLGERLVLGGNFQVHPGDLVSLDISPVVGYRWTKMLRIGLGGTYRTTFDEKEKFLLSNEKAVFGYRGYAEHDVYKGFYAHGEYERLRGTPQSAKNTLPDQRGDAWRNGALLGLGKTYQIRNRIKGNVMVLYNFLYDEHSHYNRPWNLRFGFELMGSGKPKKKESNE